MRSTRGFTIVELLFALALVALAGAAAAPQLRAGLDEWRTRGAVRYVSSRLYQARMEAALRNADTAVRFVTAGSSYEYFTVVDGNHNGIRVADMQAGVDRTVHHTERLADKFAGGMDTLTGNAPSYDAGVKAQRARTDAMPPAQRVTGEVAGGLAGGVGLAKSGLTLAGRLGPLHGRRGVVQRQRKRAVVRAQQDHPDRFGQPRRADGDQHQQLIRDGEVRLRMWRARLGSNQQPLPSEGSTLSIELRALGANYRIALWRQARARLPHL